MKNNNKIIFLFILFYVFSFINVYSDEFNFEASEIEILDDSNKLQGKNGVKINSDNGLIILADYFTYNKKDLMLNIRGNVVIYDKINKLEIFGEEFFYNKLLEKIYTQKKARVELNKKYFLDTSEFTYLVNEKKLISNSKTILKDKLDNTLITEKFYYLISKNIIRFNNSTFIDNLGNSYFFKNAMLDSKSDQIIGNDLNVDFNKIIFGNNQNDPRLKGKAFFLNKDTTTIEKGIFTACKKTDKCPPWTMSAEKIIHDKNKKIITYKDAWLKLYDKPVFYFPKFFHPDPTVKRQSGFLMPTIAESNTLGSFFKIPYYKVISENQDLTIKPRFYSSDFVILNSEYRAITKNSTHIVDSSIKNKGAKLSNQGDTQTHFFSNSKINLSNSFFDYNVLELNIEQVSNDLYLKTYDFKSPIITNTSALSSKIEYSAINEDIYIKTNFQVFEDLTVKKSSDKYEYIFPNFEMEKIFNTNESLYGTFSLDTNGYQKKYNTNVTETVLINNLNFDSYPIINKNGLLTNYSLLLKNTNSDSKNSTLFRNKKELKILSAGMLTTSYPLQSIGLKYNKTLTPRVSLRYSPSNTKNIKDNDSRIDAVNIFSFNRIASNETIENGGSLTVGTEYSILNKSNDKLFKMNLATSFRDKVNNNLPSNGTLGQASSNIFGNIDFTPNENFNLNYNFSLDDNLDGTEYDHVKADIKVNNFVNTFEFLEEINELGDNGYWSNKTSFNFDKQNSISFSKRKNTKTNINEFYNLVYQYQNDCLTAAIEYNKDFYTDNTFQETEQLYFSLTIIPFSKINSPNINK